jgi:hypothetical protein
MLMEKAMASLQNPSFPVSVVKVHQEYDIISATERHSRETTEEE